MKLKILFLSNKRSLPYSDVSGKKYFQTIQSGLSTSVGFIVDMLNELGYDATYVQVDDSNEVDKVVTEQTPNIVVLEAIWVSPEKLATLVKLHPLVRWTIRIHSEIPFLANEGNAIHWLSECKKLSNVSVSCNSDRAADEIGHILDVDGHFPAHYLPNYYGEKMQKPVVREHYKVINIGCFGAIRPMKNQLVQAVAAILFADVEMKPLNFHVNVNREETGGNNVLKNLRAMFANTVHTLVEHPWCSHNDFLKLVATMDINMQVSLSETFNIVTADAVAAGTPVVVSPEIRWLPANVHAQPNSAENIAQRLIEVYYRTDKMVEENQKYLIEYNAHAVTEWVKFMGQYKNTDVQ